MRSSTLDSDLLLTNGECSTSEVSVAISSRAPQRSESDVEFETEEEGLSVVLAPWQDEFYSLELCRWKRSSAVVSFEVELHE